MPNTPLRPRRCSICANIGFRSMTSLCCRRPRQADGRRIGAGNCGNRSHSVVSCPTSKVLRTALERRTREVSQAWRKTAKRLPDLRDLSKHLGRAIQNGEIDENYSPELRRIRRAMAHARARLTEKLESMLRSPAYSSQLQDQLVTVRNGRFVIPVRTGAKARRRRHRSRQLLPAARRSSWSRSPSSK